MDQTNSNSSDTSPNTISDKSVEISQAEQNPMVDHSRAKARYEQSSQKVTEDLSLKEITKIFTSNWALFLMILIAFSMSAVGFYIYQVPFVSTGTIIVNDAQNSSLQSFATQYFGLTKSVADGKKNNSPLQKHVEYLKTEEFFNQFLADIQERGSSKELSIAEKKGFQNIKEQLLKQEMTEERKALVLQKLDSMAKIKLTSDFEIKVSFQAEEKETALFLTNVALKTISENLTQRELLEIIKVEAFIKSQRTLAETNMTEYNQKLAEFQNKPENLISLSSKDKVGEYLSELMVRKNEIRMKIAENQKVIDFLSQGKSNRRESQLYGNGGRIQALKMENDMNRAKLADIQSAVDRVTHQAKSIPVATQVFEELKKKSEVEFENYRKLTEQLAKIEAQRLSTQSRFEILEMGRLDNVIPQISLLVLLALAFVVSQIVGSFVIYVIYIWDSNSVTAHSSRDIVIIDSHNLDPRVIMENTKIRFRLRHNHFDSDGEGSEDAQSKKLSFKMFNSKSVNGDDYENT